MRSLPCDGGSAEFRGTIGMKKFWKKSTRTQRVTTELNRAESSKTKLGSGAAPFSHSLAFPRLLRSVASFLKKNRRLLCRRPPLPLLLLCRLSSPPLFAPWAFFFMAGLLTHDLCHALDCMYTSIHNKIKYEGVFESAFCYSDLSLRCVQLPRSLSLPIFSSNNNV